MRYAYPAAMQRDEDGRYLFVFRDLPEAATDGETLAEAIAAARDLLRTALGFRIADGEPTPAPSPAMGGELLISVPVQMALKVAVVEAFTRSGQSKSALARRMGLAEIEVRRILDPWHRTEADRLEEAFLCLGGVSRLETIAPYK